MTCREEVLAAFEALHRRTDRVEFSPAEVLAQVRAAGSTYVDSTVRTHVTAHMLNDGTLIRSSPARYRLSRHRDEPAEIATDTMRPVEHVITEDDVKRTLADKLRRDGWTVDIRWGRERGIDLDARRGSERLIIEAKGQANAGPQQANYFLGAMGELVQRMNDPAARYAVAFPDHPQYRGLVSRLPSLARERLRLEVFFVDDSGAVREA